MLNAPGNLDPGRLDRRIALHYALTTRDAVGGPVRAWVEAGTVWASKRIDSGRRMFAAEQKNGEDFVTFEIRHRFDVERFWRVVHGDDVFEIVFIAPLGRSARLELVTRGVGQSLGTLLSVLVLEGTGPAAFLALEDGDPLLLEAAA